MPKLVRTIRYYTCDFKCGKKASRLLYMQEHEENCFCNPINKSCRICKYAFIDKNNDKAMCCNKLKLYTFPNEKHNKVYSFDGEIIWEKKHLDDLSEIVFDEAKYEEILKNNSNRPFPTKNCEHFIFSKKIY